MSNISIANLLKDLRKSKNLTIEKLSAIVGVSKASISKWESGEYISTENLYVLSKIYSVSLKELLNGKLDTETNFQNYKRNYDLNKFLSDIGDINKNFDKIKTFFDHCLLVKNRFYKLLPKWSNDIISKDENEEFEYLKQYFEFDKKYYGYKEDGNSQSILFVNEKEIKSFVKKMIDSINNLDHESYDWELSKLYKFKFDNQINDLLKSENIKVLEYIFSGLNQIYKDQLLYFNINLDENYKMTDKEIENNAVLKALINSGANYLYDHEIVNKSIGSDFNKFIQGKISKVQINYFEKKEISILKNWKLYSYREYLLLVNSDETNRLKDLVNLKNDNPYEYYKNMVNRNSIK